MRSKIEQDYCIGMEIIFVATKQYFPRINE